MKVIVLAGGSGTRLWPLSRKNFSKQFLKLSEEKSLLQQTLERLLRAVGSEDVIVMTNDDYKNLVASELESIKSESFSQSSKINIILEPVARNTAPAIALGVKYCIEKLGCGEDEVVFLSPSDHLIKPVDKFVEYLKNAGEIAKDGHIVTFGIKPDRPETGYGYIKTGNRQKSKSKKIEFHRVEKFTEKPDFKSAKRYLDEGNYYWNSGMFVFSIGVMIEEFKRYAPEISGFFSMNFDDMAANFFKMPDI